MKNTNTTIDYVYEFLTFYNMDMRANIKAASTSLYSLSCKFPSEISDIVVEEVRANFCVYCYSHCHEANTYDEAGKWFDDNAKRTVYELSHGSISEYRARVERKA